MLRNKLAELLAERHLKISKVALQLPNLSRNTITTTASNKGKMIQLETIDALCQYLDITPTDFFEYLPYDISCNTTITKNEALYSDMNRNAIKIKNDDIKFDFYIKLSNPNNKPEFFGYSGILTSPDSYTYLGTTIKISLENDDEQSFSDIWEKKLTPGFRPIVWQKFKKNIADALNVSMSERFQEFKDDPMIWQFEPGDIQLTTDFHADIPPEDFDDLPF